MKYIYWCFCIILFSCTSENKVKNIAVETFFKSPKQSSYHISPDGKTLSFLQPYKGRLNLFVKSVNDTASTQITSYNNQSIKLYQWAGNDKLFYMQDKDTAGNYAVFIVNKDGSGSQQIETSPKAKVKIFNQNTLNNNDFLVAINDRVLENFDVYKINIQTGKKTLYVKNPGNFVEWIADGNGQVNMAVASDGATETVYYRNNDTEDFRPIISNNFKTTLIPVGCKGEMGHIYALSNINRDKLALVDFDCETKKEAKVIYENPTNDLLEVIFSTASKKVAYVNFEVEKNEIHFIDQHFKNIYESIKAKLPNRAINIIDFDLAEKQFIVKTYNDNDPGAHYLYNVKSGELQKLSDINPEINPEDLCTTKPIEYRTSEGLIIHGYLTLPKGNRKTNLPCVVFPHQGPNARSVWGYSPEVQFLANQGYAVFQMNYRGSIGYGKAFYTAGFKQWGKLMQNDITDGVKWLISQEIINPNKIGIYGYGYGGFSALNQAVYQPDLYKCAASYSGYINLFNYLKGFPAYYKPQQEMLNQIIGNPETDIEYLKFASPIFQVDKIKTPIFIAQGGKDSRVNAIETSQFVNELKKKKLSVTYILNENETQLFTNPDNKLELYKQLGTFLNQHLHPAK